MGKPDLGRLIAQTMAPPAEGRTIEVITGEILDAKRAGGEAKYVFAADGFFIRPAASQKELTDEGNALHHCVSSYGKNHASGKTAIFFIRRKRAPKESYYTLELDEKKLEVRQNRGLRNCPRTPEVQAFEELWIRWVRAGAPRDGSGKPVIDVGREVIVA